MEDWQTRVIVERNELVDKLGRLNAFTSLTVNTTRPNFDLLLIQQLIMSAYVAILNKRIACFEEQS